MSVATHIRANDDHGGRHLGRGTVLVVEDDRAQVQALSVGLEGRGYAVHGAASGSEALDLLARPSYDVILLDMGLPDVDGLTMCTRIRDWTRCPVIVVSADAVEDRIVATLEAGADDYVIKPYSMGAAHQSCASSSRQRAAAIGDPERAGDRLSARRAGSRLSRAGCPLRWTGPAGRCSGSLRPPRSPS